MNTQNHDGQGSRFYSDINFAWRPKRIYIPAWQFSGLDYEATGAADIKSAGTGTPSATNLIVTEINTSGVTAVNMTTADNTICHLLEVPPDMDFNKPIYGSVYWTANNTSGSCDWELFYKTFVPGTTVLGTAEAATAWGAGAAQTMASVAYTVMRTPEMVIPAATLGQDTEMLQITVQMHALVTITTVSFLGLAIRYTPRYLRGPDGMKHEAKPPANIASSMY